MNLFLIGRRIFNGMVRPVINKHQLYERERDDKQKGDRLMDPVVNQFLLN